MSVPALAGHETQVVAPVKVLKEFCEQSRASTLPLPTVYLPGGASVQVVMSVDWLPVVCTDEAAYFPAGHGVQNDKPTVMATLPDEHPVHEDNPGRAAYVPTAHGVQTDWPVDWA